MNRFIQLYRDALTGLPTAVWWFSLAALINRAGTMVLPFMALYLRDELGFSTAQVGWLMASFGAGSLAGIYAAGSLVDRYGGHRMQVASLVFGGLAFLAMLMQRSFTALAVGMFVAAAFSDAFRPAVMSSVAAASDENNRARSFALLRLAVNAGMAIGPAVGGILAESDFSWIFIGEGVTCLVAAVVLGLLPAADGPKAIKAKSSPGPAATDDGRGPWQDGPFLIFVALVLLFAISFFQLFATLSLYLKDVYAWSESDVGLLIGLNAALIVVFELPTVAAVEKRSPLPIIALGCLAVSLGFGVMLFVHPAVPLIMMVLLTVGEMFVFPITSTVVASRASAARLGRYMALYGTSMSVAFIVAPPLGLYAYEQGGRWGLWGGAALLTAVAAALSMGPVRRAMVRGRPATA